MYCAVHILSKVVLNPFAFCFSHAMGTEKNTTIYVLKPDALPKIYLKPCQA